jgi:hypothetical protein
MLTVKMRVLALSALAGVGAPFAVAQVAPSSPPDIVITKSGELAAPWKKMKGCLGERDNTKAGACKPVIMNAETREIAKFGDRWSSKFAATGDGAEVKRAETALQKATRANSSSPKAN